MGTAKETMYRLVGKDLYEKVEEGSDERDDRAFAYSTTTTKVKIEGGGVLCDHCHERVDGPTLEDQLIAASVAADDARRAKYEAGCLVEAREREAASILVRMRLRDAKD